MWAFYDKNIIKKYSKHHFMILFNILVFGERDGWLKGGAAKLARERGLAVGMWTLVTAQVRELCVCFWADLALVRFYAAMNVHVLLEATRRSERFWAWRTREWTELGVTTAWVIRFFLQNANTIKFFCYNQLKGKLYCLHCPVSSLMTSRFRYHMSQPSSSQHSSAPSIWPKSRFDRSRSR